METVVIEVERREGSGKGPARRVRMAGRVPGIFYGPGREPVKLSVGTRDFSRQLAHLGGGAHLIQLKSAAPELDSRMCLIRDIQVDPMRGDALHADFFEVAMDRPIEVEVELSFVGKAEGVTLGGILQPLVREMTVRCLPTQIPDGLTIDVTKLGIHDSVHFSQIALPEGVVAVFDTDEAVVTVVPPTVDARPGAAAEGEAAAAPDAKKADAKGDAKKPEAKKGDAKK